MKKNTTKTGTAFLVSLLLGCMPAHSGNPGGEVRLVSQTVTTVELPPNTCIAPVQGRADLFIADQLNTADPGLTDFGCEPNLLTRQADGVVYFESPFIGFNRCYGYLSPTNPQIGEAVYFTVLVANRGSQTFTGSADQVWIHWATSNLLSGWPGPWLGGINAACNPAQPLGGVLAQFPLQNLTLGPASLAANGNLHLSLVALEFQWVPPTANLSCLFGSNPPRYCIAARIVNPTLPNLGMTFAEGPQFGPNVRRNRRIAWKNLTLFPFVGPLRNCPGLRTTKESTDVPPKVLQASVLMAGSHFTNQECGQNNSLQFNLPPNGSADGKTVFDYAYIDVDLGPFAADWLNNGKMGENIMIIAAGNNYEIINTDLATVELPGNTGGGQAAINLSLEASAAFYESLTRKKFVIRLLNRNAVIKGINISKTTQGALTFRLFRTKTPVTDQYQYNLNVIQRACPGQEGENETTDGGQVLSVMVKEPPFTPHPQSLELALPPTEARNRNITYQADAPVELAGSAYKTGPGSLLVENREKEPVEALLLDAAGRLISRTTVKQSAKITLPENRTAIYFLQLRQPGTRKWKTIRIAP